MRNKNTKALRFVIWGFFFAGISLGGSESINEKVALDPIAVHGHLTETIVGIESSFSDGREGKVLSTGCIIRSVPGEAVYVLTVEHAAPAENAETRVVYDQNVQSDDASGRMKFDATPILRHARMPVAMRSLLEDFEKLYDSFFFPEDAKSHLKSEEFEDTYHLIKEQLSGLHDADSIEELKRGFLSLSDLTLRLLTYRRDIYKLGQIVSLNRGIAPETYLQRFDAANQRLSQRFNSLVNESSVFTEIAILRIETERSDFKSVEFTGSKSTSCESLLMGSFYPQGQLEFRSVDRDEEARLLVNAEPGNSGSPVFCDGRVIGVVSTVSEFEGGKTSISYVSTESIYEVLKSNQLEWLIEGFPDGDGDADVMDNSSFERVLDLSEATHVLLLSEETFNGLLPPREQRLYLKQLKSAPIADEEGRAWLASARKKKTDRSNGVTTKYDYEMKLGYGYENEEMHFVVKLIGTQNGEPYSKEESLPILEGESQRYEVGPEMIDVTFKKVGRSDL